MFSLVLFCFTAVCLIIGAYYSGRTAATTESTALWKKNVDASLAVAKKWEASYNGMKEAFEQMEKANTKNETTIRSLMTIKAR